MRIVRKDNLKKLCPGIGTLVPAVCGFTPGEAACQLCRMNYKPGIEFQPYACNFGPRSRDCSQARHRFSDLNP